VLRDHGEALTPEEKSRVESVAERLTMIARKIVKPWSTDELRGAEGEAAYVYFAAFDHFIRAGKDKFQFKGRSRRPPLDEVNALLSFIYSLLAHDVCSALETVGLDPAVGFLHRDRPGRPSLALDLMEEFRPGFADRLALSLINRRQLDAARDFRRFENGAVLLSEQGRKTVLVAYQDRKREEIKHAFLDETVTVGILWHLQAQLLARHLRGDLDGYPPFVWK
jgi:CRISPR-associated protein Cas1